MKFETNQKVMILFQKSSNQKVMILFQKSAVKSESDDFVSKKCLTEIGNGDIMQKLSGRKPDRTGP